MALPNLRVNHASSKNMYEAVIARRRESEDQERARWSTRAREFKNYDVSAVKQNNWTSEKSFHDSMEAYKLKKASEQECDRLHQRQRRLSDLLEKENQIYELELKEKNTDTGDRIFHMKDRIESLKSAREEKRRKLAEELLYDQFRKNNPDLRAIEREMWNQEVVDEWSDQKEQKEQLRAAEELENLALDEVEEVKRKLEREEDDQLFRKRIVRERELQDSLKRQMKEIEEREFQAEKLRREEAALLKYQTELEELESYRVRVEKERKKRELGRALLRQHSAALRRKSKLVQEDLEADLKFLKALSDRENRDLEMQTARRERARADADEMRAVVEDQLRMEKTREAQIDDLFQEEAAKLWSKREEEWRREGEAREQLMREVMNERQKQIQEQIEENRLKQIESLRARELLLHDMERARQQTQRDEQAARRDKEEFRDQLKQQMSSREETKWRHLQEKADEEEEDRQAEIAYEELLKKEADRMRQRGYQPKSGRRDGRRF